MVRRAGMTVEDIAGLTYSPLTGLWTLGRDVDVNYMVQARKR